MQWDGVAVMLLGLVAACCTTLAFVPQVIKTLRTRSIGDLSLGMFSVMVTGIVLWLLHALIRSDLPLAVANGVTLVLAGTILVLKLRHGLTAEGDRPAPFQLFVLGSAGRSGWRNHRERVHILPLARKPCRERSQDEPERVGVEDAEIAEHESGPGPEPMSDLALRQGQQDQRVDDAIEVALHLARVTVATVQSTGAQAVDQLEVFDGVRVEEVLQQIDSREVRQRQHIDKIIPRQVEG